MKKLNKKSLDVLDTCLAAESPEVKAKVYQLIEVSELDPEDPMFLVLALTGQMRVLLETAPYELSELLKDWKEKSDSSIESIQQAIAQVRVTQQEQAQVMRGELEEISQIFVEGMKDVGMATTSAIAEANLETLREARQAKIEATQLKEELVALRKTVQQERETAAKKMSVFLERVEEPIQNLNSATAQASLFRGEIERFREKAIVMQVFEWLTPLTVIGIAAGASFICGVSVMLFKYNNDSNTLGRNLVEWNIDRILKCQQDKNKKCTLWIVTPPEKRN